MTQAEWFARRDALRERLRIRGAFQHAENANWHFESDGARNGLRLAVPVGGGYGVRFYWNYPRRAWAYWGHGR